MSRISERSTSPFTLLMAVVLLGGLGYVAWHDVYGGDKPAPPPAPLPVPPPPPLEPPASAIAKLPVQTARAPGGSREECARLAGSRASFEPEALKVFGTVVSGANSTAIVASGKAHPETVQVGDYLGAHCWRVSLIGDDSITVASAGPNPQKIEVAISAEPNTPPKKERHKRR